MLPSLHPQDKNTFGRQGLFSVSVAAVLFALVLPPLCTARERTLVIKYLGNTRIYRAAGLTSLANRGTLPRIKSNTGWGAANYRTLLVPTDLPSTLLYPLFRETLNNASSAASWSFSRLFEPLSPHLSSERLRETALKTHPSCLRSHRTSFAQRIFNDRDSTTTDFHCAGNRSINRYYPTLVDFAAAHSRVVLAIEHYYRDGFTSQGQLKRSIFGAVNGTDSSTSPAQYYGTPERCAHHFPFADALSATTYSLR